VTEQSGTADLVRVLAGTDRMADLLPQLHERAVVSAGGTCSVLLQLDPRTNTLRATSGFGLTWLSVEPWLTSRQEAEACERAFARREVVAVPDLRTSMPDLAAHLGCRAALLVPLARLHERLGMLIVGRADAGQPSDGGSAVAVVGDAFVLALERARMERDADLQRELRDLLHAFSRLASSSLKLTSGLETFCRETSRLLAADRASVWLYDRRSRELVLAASSDPQYVATSVRAVSEGSPTPPAVALRRERAEIGEMAPPDADKDEGNALSLVTVPLKGRRRALGTLVFEGLRVDPGGEIDLLDRADEVGRQISGAIENVQLLEEVLRSRRELENTVNSIPDLVAVCDARRRVVHVNRSFADRLGLGRVETMDRPLAELFGPETSDWISGLDLEPGDGGPKSYTRDMEDPVLGGTFSLTVTTLVSREGELVGSVVVARDNTSQARLEAERVALRDRLTQSEKLAALGQFVAGIAHELNNPLQGVLGHLELMRANRSVPRDIRRQVQIVYREADRAAKIIRNLLVFAGRRKVTRRPVNINAALARTLAMRADACRAANIEIVRRTDEKLPKVQGDPLLLQQALLNIIMNAEQALASAGGGKIMVRTSFSPSRNAVVVDIRDTGPGIPPDALPRIFEPFFSTKEVGKGTGLGLAITYGIVQEHGGHISAANPEEGGAVFTLELPVSRETAR